MPVQVHCPNPACGKAASVADDRIGRAARCPECGTKFMVSATPEGGAPQANARLLARETVVVPPPLFAAGAPGPGIARDLPAPIVRYQIRARLGAGAFGTVYRAYDPHLQREVALKVSHADTAGNTHAAKRFVREATATARLRHPCIVSVFDAGSDGSHSYIASAFIDGRTLAQVLQDGPMDCRRAARVVRDLAEALAYAHRQGIVHRDVKPANIMLDKAGQTYLMDFGLAYRQDARTQLTHDGAILGTPSYMAPEQAQGKSGDALPASDQYGLGVVLYELVCGRTPFEGARSEVVLYHVVHEEPPAPRSVNGKVPRDLETICLKAMAKRPEDRYGSCQELADDLGRFERGEPIAARPVGMVERAWRWGRRNPALAALSATVAALVVVVLAGLGVLANLLDQSGVALPPPATEKMVQSGRIEKGHQEKAPGKEQQQADQATPKEKPLDEARRKQQEADAETVRKQKQEDEARRKQQEADAETLQKQKQQDEARRKQVIAAYDAAMSEGEKALTDDRLADAIVKYDEAIEVISEAGPLLAKEPAAARLLSNAQEAKTNTQKKVKVLRKKLLERSTLGGHSNAVQSVAWSPDGKRLALKQARIPKPTGQASAWR